MHGNLKNLQRTEPPGQFDAVATDGLRMVRSRSFYERRVKRPFDVVAASVLLVVSLPVSAAIAVAVRVGLGKEILYKQERVGIEGTSFTIFKFRTMRPDRRNRDAAVQIEHDRRAGHKVLTDPRHTGLGRLLRRLSLDELPQLVNVLLGEMSLVGPRPEIVDVARERGYVNHVRHDVRPGMTGPYQTSDLRLNGDLRDGLSLDTTYVDELSFRSDLRYMLRTVSVMLHRSSGS